jgi:hypothetical protein
MDSKVPGITDEMNAFALNNNSELTDNFKALLTKYPYIYVRYMLDRTVTEMNTAANDNVEQVTNYDKMIKLQTWAKKE